MDRIDTLVALDEITSAFLNDLQDAIAPLVWLDGYLQGGFVSCTSPNAIRVSAIPTLIIDGGRCTFSSEISSTPTPSAAGWYYVYAYNNAGTPALVIATTAPTDYLLYKSDDPTRRFLGAFAVWDDSGTKRVVPFRQEVGRVLYRVGSHSVQLRVDEITVPASTPTTTTVDLSSLVPPHARVAILDLDINAVNDATVHVSLRPHGDSQDTIDQILAVTPGAGMTVRARYRVEIETDDDRKIDVSVVGNTTDDAIVGVYVMGYLERVPRG